MSSNKHTIGAYEVMDEIGRGGMGVVYKVRHQKTGKICALKMVLPENMREEADRLRFKREFRAMQRVDHPNVVRVFESGSDRNRPYFTMELIQGIPLFQWLDGGEKLIKGSKGKLNEKPWPKEKADKLNTPERIERIRAAFEQLSKALTAIHRHRIVHRDLKPDNIFVTARGELKIMDFGIAKTLGNHTEFSSGRLLVGTYRYLAPEQALGIRVDTRADLYCMGVLLYEAVAGRHPFYSETDVGYAFHHARTIPQKVNAYNEEAPFDLAQLIEQLMNKEPTRRIASAGEVAFLLRSPLENTDAEMAQDHLDGGPIIFEPALIGRDPEIRTFEGLCKKTVRGKGSVLWLSGQENIGKSRILEQALAMGRSQNLDVIVSYCDPEDKSPFQPFVKIIDKMVRVAQNLPATVFQQMIGKSRDILAAHIPSLRKLNDPGAQHIMPALNTQNDPKQFFQAVWSFVSRYAMSRPVLIAIDDFHFADELSILLAEQLAKKMARHQQDKKKSIPLQLGLLFTSDVDTESTSRMRPLLEKISHIHGFQPMPLRPLTQGQVGEVVASMLGGAAVAQVIKERIHKDTKGLPGLVENQVRVWVDSGYLQRQKRVWVLSRQVSSESGLTNLKSLKEATNIIDISQVTQADLGDSEELSVFAEIRLEGLSDVARDLLPYIALIGQRTSFLFLKRVVPFSEDMLLDAINELLESQVLHESRERQDYLLPSSDRKLVSKNLEHGQKKRIHLLIAEALKKQAQMSGEPLAHQRIAHHMLEAGYETQALIHWVHAAQKALNNSANETAAELIRNAHKVLKRKGVSAQTDPLVVRAEFELTLMRLSALNRIGNHDACAELASRRRENYKKKQNKINLARFNIQVAESLVQVGKIEQAKNLAEKVLRLTKLPKDLLPLRGRAHRLLGQVYALEGSYEKSTTSLKRALWLCRNLNKHSEAEQAQSELADQHFWAGHVREAHKDFTELFNHAQQRHDSPNVIRYTYMLGETARAENQLKKAEQFFRKSIALAKPAGNQAAVGKGMAALALIKAINQNPEEAINICRQSLKILKEEQNKRNYAHAELVLARIQMDLGDKDGTDQTLRNVIAYAQEAKDTPMELEAVLRRILLHSQHKEPKTAEKHWASANSLAAQVDNQRLQLLTVYTKAQYLKAQNRHEQAETMVISALNQPIPPLARQMFTQLRSELLAP